MIRTDAIRSGEFIKDRQASLAIGVFFFIAATTLGAYVRIPLWFTPVPITLQTFFVILSGAVLGRRAGALSQLGYLALGLAGIPLFQGYGSGFAHIAGPTGGYIIGFIACSFITGYLVDMKRESAGFTWVLFSMAAGLAFIYIFGVMWLKAFLGLGLGQAVFMGFVPFAPGAVLKLIAASALYVKIYKRTNRIFF